MLLLDLGQGANEDKKMQVMNSFPKQQPSAISLYNNIGRLNMQNLHGKLLFVVSCTTNTCLKRRCKSN